MITKGLLRDFQKLLGTDKVFADEAELLAHSYDAAPLPQRMPSLVVRPDSAESMGGVVRLCSQHGLPLTVRGAGTNLSGGTIPSRGGVVLLTGGMNRILELNDEDMYAVVEPGVVTADLARAAEARGLFYPPDPGSMAVSTIGGNVAENAGGLRGLKYGVTRDYVMGLEFFSADGEPVTTGARTVKCVTGYNLGALMIGSEGTLGVLSRATLKLVPKPAARRSLIAVFGHMDHASNAVSAVIARRITPATLEIMDHVTIQAVEDFSHAGLPRDARALLLMEVDGHPAQVADEADVVERVCRESGATLVRTAGNDAERDQIWGARRSALSALARLKPTLVLEDATVPRSRIPDMVRAVQEVAREYSLTIGVFGHAGDGNLHPTILTDRRDTAEWERVERAIEAIFDRALALGGTLSGEHGIGLAKAHFLERETNLATVLFSRRLKKALDPNNILNPGKMFGDDA